MCTDSSHDLWGMRCTLARGNQDPERGPQVWRVDLMCVATRFKIQVDGPYGGLVCLRCGSTYS